MKLAMQAAKPPPLRDETKPDRVRSHASWTRREHALLLERHAAGLSIDDLTILHGRSREAIKTRLKRSLE